MSENYSQLQKILANNGVAGDRFSHDVALSMYGDVALVGAAGDLDFIGSAYVFTYSDAQWVQQQKLIASDGGQPQSFGYAVALSADGGTALIGAPNDSDIRGSAYFFIKTGTTWSFSEKIKAVTPASYQFGRDVALSADGNLAFIAQESFSSVFARSDLSWIPTTVISDVTANFGDSVALSSVGNAALIGATQAGIGGKAWIFMSSDFSIAPAVYTSINFSSNDVASSDDFGMSVALSGDGQTALVGAPGKNSNQGAAYVFIYSDGYWPQQHKFLASDGGVNDRFGSSVALGVSPEGHNIALIGARGGNKSYVFERVDNTWKEVQKIVASDSSLSSNFGNAVALAGDGLIGLIGASAFSDHQGSGYFFGSAPSNTPAPGTNTTLIKFLPDILITTIVLYGGVVGLFLFNASKE